MVHHISEREWLDYVGGALEPSQEALIRQHVDACRECEKRNQKNSLSNAKHRGNHSDEHRNEENHEQAYWIHLIALA